MVSLDVLIQLAGLEDTLGVVLESRGSGVTLPHTGMVMGVVVVTVDVVVILADVGSGT